MKQIITSTVMTGLLVVSSPGSSSASTIFAESWEMPSLISGSISATLPESWYRFSGPIASSQIWFPEGSTRFVETNPLASPASGKQLLYLSGINTGVYRMSGVVIQPNTIYTLSAALGNDLLTSNTHYWSLQLWADTNNSGWFEGTFASVQDTFIGQKSGASPYAANPTEGNWSVNSYSFDTTETPSLVGSQLVVFLNNFGDGVSFYDNVTLASAPSPSSSVPVPSAASLLGTVLVSLALIGRRAKQYMP